jgi:predicted adenine nucleotide alpha hydrolase (AANH) superfamily ATPase
MCTSDQHMEQEEWTSTAVEMANGVRCVSCFDMLFAMVAVSEGCSGP